LPGCGSAPARSAGRGLRTHAWRSAVVAGFAAIALTIAGVSRAAAADSGLTTTSPTTAPTITDPAGTAPPADAAAPTPADTGSAVADPPTSAAAPGTGVPGAADPGVVVDQVAAENPGRRTEEQWRPHAWGSAGADSAGLGPDATGEAGQDERAGAVAPADPGGDDTTAPIGDGAAKAESATPDSGASPEAKRGTPVADSATASTDATSGTPTSTNVADSGTATAGPPPSSTVSTPAMRASTSGHRGRPFMEQRSGALAKRRALAVRGEHPATPSFPVLWSGAAPGLASVALQPFADAPSVGWNPADRAGPGARTDRAKPAPATSTDTGYRPGAPSAPTGRAVGMGSSAASAGAGVTSVCCALVFGLALAAARQLRRHRLRLVVSAPVGFSAPLERPG
jgi:hypothetical protein